MEETQVQSITYVNDDIIFASDDHTISVYGVVYHYDHMTFPVSQR